MRRSVPISNCVNEKVSLPILMKMNEEVINSPINNQSILSLVFGILTILSFCMGLAPLPFTGFICFPISFLLGILALVFGAISLNRIRSHNESGRAMAWIGIVIGGICFSVRDVYDRRDHIVFHLGT